MDGVDREDKTEVAGDTSSPKPPRRALWVAGQGWHSLQEEGVSYRKLASCANRYMCPAPPLILTIRGIADAYRRTRKSKRTQTDAPQN